MLIHITPQLFTGSAIVQASLVDVRLPELNLELKGGHELTARKPYPNKCYLVACRKNGQKAIIGLLIETDMWLDTFAVITRWATEGEIVLTHRVRYVVLDKEFDTVSDSVELWSGNEEFRSRWPACIPETAPVRVQSRMDVSKADARLSTGEARRKEFHDNYSYGMVINRRNVFRAPTIERERLFSPSSPHMLRECLPTIESAFKI